MNKLVLAARIVFGLIFFVFGLNGFLNFLPVPAMPETAMSFAMALANSGYMFPLIKSIEVLVGVLLLSGYFVPLALILIAPISINIFCFHAFLTPGPQNVVLPLVIIGLNIFLAWAHKAAYAPLFKAK